MGTVAKRSLRKRIQFAVSTVVLKIRITININILGISILRHPVLLIVHRPFKRPHNIVSWYAHVLRYPGKMYIRSSCNAAINIVGRLSFSFHPNPRRFYMRQLFYSQPSADFAINYRWPTRASLQQTLGHQQPNSEVDDNTTLTATFSRGGSSCVSPHKSGGHSRTEPAISTTQSVATSNSTGESSSTRPFHSFRGKKAHQIIPVRDCFVPPRHIAELTTNKHGNASPEVSVPFAPSHGAARRPATHPAATAGLTRAVHLPPMAETPREGRPYALPAGGPNAVGGGKHQWLKKQQLLKPKPGAPGQSLMPSFQRKFDAKHEAWSREAEEHAEERIFEEQWRADDLLRERRGRDIGGGGGGSDGGGRDMYEPKRGDMFGSAVEEGRGELGDARRPRRTRRRGRRDGDYCDEGTVAELIPEREEELLTQMFQMLDARDVGEVQLDEVLFHMTENAQVHLIIGELGQTGENCV